MLGLARLAMRGPFAATAAVAVFGVLALPFGPSLLLSGALLALVTLRRGALAGLKTLLGAALGGALVLLGLTGHLGIAAVTVLSAWVPAWASAASLRRTQRQGQALAGLAAWVMGYAAGMRWRHPDVDAFWQERLRALGSMVEAQGGRFLTEEQLALYGSLMHEASLALIFVMLAGMLITARAWQAGLYNPGGFRTEFHALSLPPWVSPVGALVALVSLLPMAGSTVGGLADDGIVVLLLLFALQGLAVTHALCAQRGLGRGWLFGLYLLLGLLPQGVIPVLAIVGIADRMGNFRRRDGRQRPP